MWQCRSCGEQLPDGIEACWLCGTAADGTADPTFVAEEMPERRLPPAAATPELSAPEPGAARQLWIEVLVVVAVAVLPDLWWAIADLMWDLTALSAAAHSVAACVRSTTVSAVVLYLLWRSGDPWKSFGLSRPRAWDLVVGFLVALAVGVAHQVFLALIWHAVPASWKESLDSGVEQLAAPQSAAGWVLVVTAELANGFAEELAMRAYLLLRLRQLLGSSTRALLLSSALFASYHVYQGPWGCVSAFVSGVLLGLVFLKIRRLWPIALAHAIRNLNIVLSGWLA